MRKSADGACSSLASGRASKSHSHDWRSFGELPLTSISTPHRRAAMVAFQIRGFGRYEKIRSWVTASPSPGLAKRPELDVERPGGAVLMRDVPDFLGDRRGFDEEVVGGV